MNRLRRALDTPATCTMCKVLKQPEEFHKTKFSTLASWCRKCVNESNRVAYHVNKEKKNPCG
ncbi:hypothetical protein UFOVP1025_9 [uncultured Caudovirales phage]|uniref:Uncharacterized protein n=1 Tax=uncultured Caudovirales phage TaxID=2100421 RepID=A0A6J5Q912_9CAUD|nr:hypothetical protein UFOVP852_25 [uncultured Caudovirales phage]CAB4173328.1 hypothetical protein UFOVP948_48 [uncultured Caudovirales phage]CAB4178857.1 hypothetical protein UFOVP1025_9 [uncultured Caudovirales phage]CAB4219854.1 hypothetical protein UFOVP1628_12 [uncultured Caudovirales phage]